MFTPYGMRYIYPSMIQLGNELDESAEVCGATPLKAFRTILAPHLRPAFLAGWMFVFLLIGRELTMSVFLASSSYNIAGY